MSLPAKVELLAPAGDINKLEIALTYGADAVYLSGENFGLRAMAGNFDNENLKKAVEMVHSKGKKIYVTVNIFARNDDFEGLKKHVQYLQQIGVDAVIVSDLGVLRMVRENTNLEIHISTQANVLNKYTAEEYVRLGAKRIILARECSLNEIKEIAAHLKGQADIEVFVHGAMCVSYSGRCMLSDYIIGGKRSSNRGACVQPCRFSYALMEEKRPNEFYTIEQDNKGTYIMNSRDLCLIEHLNELAQAGVTSFKIEGRTKSEHYVAGVTNTYRKAIDALEQKNKKTKTDTNYITELEKISHRPYTTGFVFEEKGKQNYQTSLPIATHEFAAIIIDSNTPAASRHSSVQENYYLIERRNNFSVGDTLEILSPREIHNKTFEVTSLSNLDGEPVICAKNAQELLIIPCPFKLQKGDILRKKLN